MWDIGLKLRLFLTIFTVLALTALSTSYIHFHFFKAERMRLVEQNLQQNAHLLSRADFSSLDEDDMDSMQEAIVETIGDEKVNIIVGIYDENGELLFRNENADIFELPEDLSEVKFASFEDVETKDFLIKYFTMKSGPEGRTIKVGMVLSQTLLKWEYLGQRLIILIGIILLLSSIMSYLLTSLLFHPINRLAEQVNSMASKLEAGKFADLKSWFGIVKGHKKNDGFSHLISSLDRLASRVAENQILTQKWSALMAHELKTPMTTLKISVENLLNESSIPPEKILAVEQELRTLDQIIMDFLEWASLENDPHRPELHVVNLSKRTEQVAKVLQESFPHSHIKLTTLSTADQRIFCNPIHFDQVINNLVTNAIKYGKRGEVQLELGGGYLKIADQGRGIPTIVLENYGHPFNNFKQGEQKGYGLGLAWVNTISKKYGWDISFDTSHGTCIKIIFNELLET